MTGWIRTTSWLTLPNALKPNDAYRFRARRIRSSAPPDEAVGLAAHPVILTHTMQNFPGMAAVLDGFA